MFFEQLIENLSNGESNVFSNGSNQNFKATSERFNGIDTGFQVVKATGGKVTRRIAENTLLNGVQNLFVKKGLTEFGNDGLIEIANTEIEVMQSKLIANSVNPSMLSAIVKRYLKQLEVEFILTDLQVLEVLQTVCQSELNTAENIVRATEEQRDAAINSASKFNDAVIAERNAAAAALLNAASA